MVKISVIVCTYNRANLLPELLKKLTEQSLSKEEYEVIIVDNASKDNTGEIAGSFIGKHPNFRYFYESRQGASCSRNRGAKEARGNIVVFLDDDTLPDIDCLKEHAQTYDSVPDAVSVGGRIELLMPEGRMPETLEPYKMFLGYFSPAKDRFLLQWPTFPIECNFSVRREVGEKFGWFSEKLGRKENSLISNDGASFFYEIMVKRRLPVVYNPKAVIEHLVPPERLTKTFILRRTYAQGISDAIFERFFIGPDSLLYWSKKKLFRKYIQARFKTFMAGRKKKKDPFFHLCFKMSYFLGYYRGFFIGNR